MKSGWRLRAVVSAGALSAALLLAGVAESATIVYNVNQVFGDGSVKGTLTTDGALGPLAGPDFLAWDLLLTGAAGGTYELTDANSVVAIVGSDLTATSSEILFDFSGDSNSYFLIQDGLFSGMHYWCNAAGGGTCLQGVSITPGAVFDANFVNVPEAGSQVIATAGVVPEASTWAMLIAGFGGLGLGALWRRTKPAAALA